MKKTLQRFILVPTIFGALLAAGIFVVPGATHAASRQTHAAVTCYGQATQIGPYTIIPTDFEIVTTYIATQYCNDINFKATQQAGPTQARVIFKDIKTGAVKGYGSWKNIDSANTWYVLATNVLDGTHYTVEFKVPYEGTTFEGLLAG